MGRHTQHMNLPCASEKKKGNHPERASRITAGFDPAFFATEINISKSANILMIQ